MTHWFRRAVGVMLVAVTIVPVYEGLRSRETGLAGRSTVDIVAVQTALLWSGALVLAILAVLAGLVLDRDRAARAERAVSRLLGRPSPRAFAAIAGTLATLVTALAAWFVFERRPNLVDALLQLTHARYLAQGLLGGPAAFGDGFWHMQNAVLTTEGWYSQYPPGHALLLAAGVAAGAVWVVGPLVMGVTAAACALLLARLLPDRPVAARIAALGVALSPFLIPHAASYMNHASAAMFSVLAVWFAVRAQDRAAWAAAAGAAVAAAAAVRPVSAVVTMCVVIAVWVQASRARGASVALALRTLARPGWRATLGGLPLLGLHLWYNAAAFGSPLRFGYTAAWGPSHGLGFHRDPWGNAYGPVEAALYSAADLAALNASLLETLLPHVSLVGLFLIVARTLAPGERVLALWALLPVAANALYWHHGQFMGPRMLAEFAPAWTALAVVAAGHLIQRAPLTLGGSRFSPRTAASALAFGAAGAFVVMAPQRTLSYGGEWLPGFRAPAPPAPPNAIVFIHGAWETRVMSRLATHDVRLDRIETAMRQNPTCDVHRHLLALRDGGPFGAARGALSGLDLEPSASEYQPRLLVARDARIRVDTTRALPLECLAEVSADRFGAIDASFVLWLGDLPGIESGRPLYARDLGPEINARLLARYPGRAPYLFGFFAEADSARLLPYDEGRRVLWGPAN